MTRARAALPWLAMACGVVLALASCSPAQQQTAVARIGAGVREAHATTNRARDAYVTAQRIAEAAVVAAAPNEAAGIEALARLDTARAPVLRAFAVAYAALARAESLIELVAAGKREPMALVQAALEVARTAEDVAAAVRGAR